MGNQLTVTQSTDLSSSGQGPEETTLAFQGYPYQKLYKDGHVAVLYSPGFGAGWWTWNREYEGLIFDADIAQALLSGDRDRIAEIAASRYPDAYLGGLEDLEVWWVPMGARFEITEYDGSERIHLLDDKPWFIA